MAFQIAIEDLGAGYAGLTARVANAAIGSPNGDHVLGNATLFTDCR